MIIYALTDPRDGRIRYVGKSHRSAHRRLRRHLAPCYLKGQTHKERWIRSLLAMGLEPGIVVLRRCDSAEDLARAEILQIALLKKSGSDLTNATPGGDGGAGPHTEISKERIRAALTGKPKSETHRLRSGLAQRGRITSPETRALLSAKASRPRGRLTPKHCASMAVGRGAGPFVDQNGNRYETQKEAARLLQLCQGHISRVLRGQRSHVGGYRFRYIDHDLRVREMPR